MLVRSSVDVPATPYFYNQAPRNQNQERPHDIGELNASNTDEWADRHHGPRTYNLAGKFSDLILKKPRKEVSTIRPGEYRHDNSSYDFTRKPSALRV
jgi:hypothetical protein